MRRAGGACSPGRPPARGPLLGASAPLFHHCALASARERKQEEAFQQLGRKLRKFITGTGECRGQESGLGTDGEDREVGWAWWAWEARFCPGVGLASLGGDTQGAGWLAVRFNHGSWQLAVFSQISGKNPKDVMSEGRGQVL